MNLKRKLYQYLKSKYEPSTNSPETTIVSIIKITSSTEDIYFLNYPEYGWHASYTTRSLAWHELWRLFQREERGK